MKKIEINGRTITTNYGQDHSIVGANWDRPCEGARWILNEGDKYCHLESETEMFERLVKEGYSRITFYYTTTRVRGLYNLIAVCK